MLLDNLLTSLGRKTKIDFHYFAKGSFWLSLGQVIASIFSLLIAIAFANLVSPDIFGTYKYIISMISLLSIPTLNGISISYHQAVSRGYEGAYLKIIRTKITWGLVGAVGALILAGYYLFQGNHTLGFAFIIVSAFIPFFETLGFYSALLGGRKLFKLSAKYFILSRSISFICLLSTLFLSDNIFLILLSYLLPLTLTQFILERHAFFTLKPNEIEDERVISSGKHLSLIDAFNGSTRYLDNLLLFTMVSAPAVAIYTFATAPTDQVSALHKILTNLMVPKLSKKSGREIHETFIKRLMLVTLVSAVISLIYVSLVPLIYPTIFPLYPEAIVFAQILSIALFLNLPSSFLNGVIQSRLDVTPTKLLYWRIIPRLIFLLSLLILVPTYGIFGAIISRVILAIATIMNQFLYYIRLISLER